MDSFQSSTVKLWYLFARLKRLSLFPLLRSRLETATSPLRHHKTAFCWQYFCWLESCVVYLPNSASVKKSFSIFWRTGLDVLIFCPTAVWIQLIQFFAKCVRVKSPVSWNLWSHSELFNLHSESFWLFPCLGVIPPDFTPGLRLLHPTVWSQWLVMNNAFYSECLQWYNCHPCLLTHDSNTFPYQEMRKTSTASSLTLILLLESFRSQPQVRRNNHDPRCRRCCCWCCRVINISSSSHIIRVHLGKFHFKFHEGCWKD